MRPDTSHWRDGRRYEFFDTLSVEGLAWECLRRFERYQEHYGELVAMKAEDHPYSTDAQRHWGLRFPGSSEPFRASSGRPMVAACQSGDGPPRVAGLMRSALLAADLVLIPVQPSPFDGWASAEMLSLIAEARIYRPDLVARFVLNRCAARTVLGRETAAALADHDPPVLASRVGQRVAFASAAQTGRLVHELDGAAPAADEIAALVDEIERLPRTRRAS